MLQSQYLTELKWIQPTTVIVERLFSKCRGVMNYKQKRMLPRVFEAIIFLNENKGFWEHNTSIIQDMILGKWDNQLGEEYDSDDEDDDVM